MSDPKKEPCDKCGLYKVKDDLFIVTHTGNVNLKGETLLRICDKHKERKICVE